MSPTDKLVLRAAILIPVSLFSIFALTLICIVFGFLNQSIHTPKEDQLTFVNYLLPYIMTVAFISYFTVKKILSKKGKSRNVISRVFAIVGSIISLPWQFQHLNGYVKRQSFDPLEWMPFIIGITFTLWLLMEEWLKK